jgi:cytochrome c oxidase subunit 3
VSSETLELHDAHAHATHAHQFDDAVQQRESAALGMWAFLATEVLFFGGLFLCYTVFRYRYPVMWDAGSHILNVWMGGINTVILLTSSLSMALGVHAAQTGKTKQLTMYLIITILFAFGFLVIKSFEYHDKWEESLIPGRHFQADPEVVKEAFERHGFKLEAPDGSVETTPPTLTTYDPMGPNLGPVATNEETLNRAPLTPLMSDDVRKLQLFFALYFAMTGLHAFHVIIGIALIGSLVFLNWRGWFTKDYNTPVVMIGLYWHFVDIVWIVIFTAVYLLEYL